LFRSNPAFWSAVARVSPSAIHTTTGPDGDAARARRASRWATRVSRIDRLMHRRSSSAERRAETAAWLPGPPCRGPPARWLRASRQSIHSPGYLPHSALLRGRFRPLMRPRSSAPAVDPPPPTFRAAAVAGACASSPGSSAADLPPASLAQGGIEAKALGFGHDGIHAGPHRPASLGKAGIEAKALGFGHDGIHAGPHRLADLAHHRLDLALICEVYRQ